MRRYWWVFAVACIVGICVVGACKRAVDFDDIDIRGEEPYWGER